MIVCGIISVLIWFVIFQSQSGRDVRKSIITSDTLELNFSSTVDSVGYDYLDHNSPKIYLRNKDEIDLSFVLNDAEILNACHSGDKISKQKNSFVISITHLDSITTNIEMKFAK